MKTFQMIFKNMKKIGGLGFYETISRDNIEG